MFITKIVVDLYHINKLKNMGFEKNKIKTNVNFNQEHYDKVVAAQKVDSRITFKAKEIDKLRFQKLCRSQGLNPSLVLRELMIRFTKKN